MVYNEVQTQLKCIKHTRQKFSLALRLDVSIPSSPSLRFSRLVISAQDVRDAEHEMDSPGGYYNLKLTLLQLLVHQCFAVFCKHMTGPSR